MNEQEIITCLANVLAVAGADDNLAPQEKTIIESIRQNLGATRDHLEQAVAWIHEGDYAVTPAGRFSDQVRNLEDMLLTTMADGDLAAAEKTEILAFSKALEMTQAQINRVLAQTKAMLAPGPGLCPQCQAEAPESAKFCTACGAKLS